MTEVSGLFNSCATPATNSPMPESFSLWINWACVVLSVSTVVSSCSREFFRFSVIWLNTCASSPHSSRVRTSTRREKSPRPTASALSRNSSNGAVTLRTRNQIAHRAHQNAQGADR